LPRGIPLTAAALAAVLVLAGPAAAEEGGAERLRLAYAIYAGGFDVLDATVLLDYAGRRYGVTVAARTEGLIGTLVPWQVEASSRGVLTSAPTGAPAGSRAMPERHRLDGTLRGEPRRVRLDYDRSGGVAAALVPPVEEEDRDPVPVELTRNTVDPLSAAIGALSAASAGQGCTGTAPVYDGRRRYDLKFQQRGQRVLEPSRYSSFSGTAEVCEITWTLLAGRSRNPRHRDDRTGRRAPLQVLLAPVVANGPKVPVRIEGESAFGSLVIHLTAASAETGSTALADPGMGAGMR
jgi:hypothetical protein